jgi:hypothetical protein
MLSSFRPHTMLCASVIHCPHDFCEAFSGPDATIYTLSNMLCPNTLSNCPSTLVSVISELKEFLKAAEIMEIPTITRTDKALQWLSLPLQSQKLQISMPNCNGYPLMVVAPRNLHNWAHKSLISCCLSRYAMIDCSSLPQCSGGVPHLQNHTLLANFSPLFRFQQAKKRNHSGALKVL